MPPQPRAPQGPAHQPSIPAPVTADTVVASIGEAIITTDTALRVTHLNPSAERLTGWKISEALGQPVDTLLILISDTTRLPLASTAVRCLAEGRSVDLEPGASLLRRDGAKVPIRDSTAPILNGAGEVIGVVLVLRNETENRRVARRVSCEGNQEFPTGPIHRRDLKRRAARVDSTRSAGSDENARLYRDLD